MHQFFSGDSISGLVMPDHIPGNRETRRAAEDMGPAFSDMFDFRTLFYDAYLSPLTGHVELLGPPLFNLESAIQDIFLSEKGSRVAPVTRRRKQLERRQFKLKNPGAAEDQAITVKLEDGSAFVLPVAPPDFRFDGRQTLLTMFRYEPLHWVVDWLAYHVANHGVNAALIYCNNMPHLSVKDVSDAIKAVEGLEASAVVAWNYPYGPAGKEAGNRPYDSVFCKPAMFEHARTRFLSKAAGVINADVDELVVVTDQRSVFEVLEDSGRDGIVYECWMVSGPAEELKTDLAERRHAQYYKEALDRAPPKRPKKWALDPTRMKRRGQWLTHTIVKADVQRIKDLVWYAHLAPLNTSWKTGQRAGVGAKGEDIPSLMESYRKAGWM